MELELELVTDEISEEDFFQLGNDNDDSTFEGERCGICMDVIIDRGVLDCCQHWFCFACIDNWATITNLCPLCQNEFQLITCVPVYDTTGSNKVEDDSFPRDDDWCIEGKNSSLSFPSYYIDENAVVCLDGDGCKIRSGATIDDDLNFDTSIACDSCDIWYHAFCVGFDTESTTESTWLCPRCEVCEMPQGSDTTSVQRPNNQGSAAYVTGESSVEAALSGKVSVSVADVGETAVVVSMVGGNQWTEEPQVNFFSSSEVGMDRNSEAITLRSVSSSSKVETSSNKRTNSQPEMDAQEPELSLSHDKSCSLSSHTFALSDFKENCADKGMKKQNDLEGIRITEETSENDSSTSLHLGLSAGSVLCGDNVKNDGTKDQMAVGVQQDNPLDESCILDDKIVNDAMEGAVGITGIKRKHKNCSENVRTNTENGGSKANLESGFSAKKVKPVQKTQMVPSSDKAEKSDTDDFKMHHNPITVTKDDKGRHNSGNEDVTSDIMSIVQGTDRRALKGLARPNTADKSSKEREAGLRVKKIMRRAAKDKESSIIVQELRKEIREAVKNKSSIDLGKKLFDPKLLAAFRAAVAGPVTEPAKKLSHLVVKAKKSIIQKGKARENLTKKIYGINGRRKRAWDRDCEIEFWKHRCMRTTKPEKIETLKSVLDLLRKNTEGRETEKQSGLQATNPILSRLYLADTSVFPRKDNIKPLSAVNAAGEAEVNIEQHSSVENSCKISFMSRAVKRPETYKVSPRVCVPSFDKDKKDNVACLKGYAASSKVNINSSSDGPSPSMLRGSKVNPQKEVIVKSDDVRSDKRKWALEVLARKTAGASRNATQEKQGDGAVLKGNYPLLAQLPIDMRPVLAPSRNNKIPISIRQAQLYRLTEQFLRKTNLPVIRRTADTELAVADAVNIEKEVADRSNSKLVYVNLCAQELLRRSDNSNTDRDVKSNPSPPLAVSVDISEQATNNLSSDLDVEEALRTAGLLSDTPPSSPREEKNDLSDEDDPSKKKEEEPDDIFEMDSQPELDIYGDFEYDLEEEDYIGACAINVSKLQSEEESSKMKVVFSTLNSDKPNNALNCEISEGRQGISEVRKDSDSLLKCRTDTEFHGSTMDGTIDKSCPPLEPIAGEGGEEPSLAECEELYGPDKEPLVERFPEVASELYGAIGTEPLAKNITEECGETYPSNQKARAAEPNESYAENHIVATIGHNSTGGKSFPNNSQASENGHKKENRSNTESKKQSDSGSSVSKKVEAYIKEHIRPLCKSGVITAEQYRWAVAKTTEKVMKYHSKDKNASFLIKEGEKVKKLAEQYIEAAPQKEKK